METEKKTAPTDHVIELLEAIRVEIEQFRNEIIAELVKEKVFDKALSTIYDRIIRFKIKSEILRLKFELGKMNVKDTFREQGRQINQKISNLKRIAKETEEGLETKWNGFSEEVAKTYSHLQKPFTSK